MGKNIIVSEDTIRDLLEAHASLSAWYYELWSALRLANGSANAPGDAARAAFVERLASSYPEVAAVARKIRVPRMFVPPPPALPLPFGSAEDCEEPTMVEPASRRLRELSGHPPPIPDSSPKSTPRAESHETPRGQADATPLPVIPSLVKY
jgi:hypothetical protein